MSDITVEKGNDKEARKTSKKQANRLRFILEASFSCTFFVLCSHSMHNVNHSNSIG